MTLVIDASVAVAWCLDDQESGYADRVLTALRGEDAVVPHHWALEVANALLMAERRGRLDAAETPGLVDLLLSLPIVPDPTTRDRDLTVTLATARRHGLSNYDAAYLELAQRLGTPLATLDQALASAAQREGPGHWQP